MIIWRENHGKSEMSRGSVGACKPLQFHPAHCTQALLAWKRRTSHFVVLLDTLVHLHASKINLRFNSVCHETSIAIACFLSSNGKPRIRATFCCNLSRHKCCIAVAIVCSRFYHRATVVIRATNNRNLQRNICCPTSCKKMLPVLLSLLGP